MIDGTAIKELDRLAREAASAELKPYKPDAEPAHVYYLGHERKEAMSATRQHVAADLSAIVEFAKASEKSAVWYHRTGVVCLIDDGTRRDQVRLPLTYSPQLKTIMGWEEKKRSEPFSQAELILLLRTMFKHNLSKHPQIIESLRKIKFKNNSGGESTKGHGKVSVGRQIEQEVTGAQDLPEDFIFDVPVFENLQRSKRYSIEVALEIDAGTERFQLIPIPGSVEGIISLAEDDILEDLEGLGLVGFERLHYGKP